MSEGLKTHPMAHGKTFVIWCFAYAVMLVRKIEFLTSKAFILVSGMSRKTRAIEKMFEPTKKKSTPAPCGWKLPYISGKHIASPAAKALFIWEILSMTR